MIGDLHSGEHGDSLAWWITFHSSIREVEHSRLCLVFGDYSLLTRFNCLSKQVGLGGGGHLEGCNGLPALQPVPCASSFCMGGEGHVCLVYPYFWSIGYCVTWYNMSVPSSCHY